MATDDDDRQAIHPLIVPTKKIPAWSKMPLPRDVVENLRRIGGA